MLRRHRQSGASSQGHRDYLSAEIIRENAKRSMPRMHWRWRNRGHDIETLLRSRFGSRLPDNRAGQDGAALLAAHFMCLTINAESVTRKNLHLWAPWLSEKTITKLVQRYRTKRGKKSKTISAAKLGRDWRVTPEELARYKFSTITAITVTLENERNRQARRRRNSGASTRRGRPKFEGLRPWQIAGASSKAAYYRALKNKAKTSETEIRHASSYNRRMERDDFQSRYSPASLSAWIASRTPADLKRLITVTAGISIVLAKIGPLDMAA